MTARQRKLLTWGPAALALVVVVLLMLRKSPLRVETTIVGRGPLMVTVDAEGQTRVRDRYTVSAPVNGRLLRPAFRAGDRVRAGDIVAYLEPPPLDARALEQARTRVAAAEDAERVATSAVVSARAAMIAAERESQRAESLAAVGLIAPAERERAEVTSVTRERELEAAQFHARASGHDVETARAGLLASADGNRTTRIPVRTPVSGQLLRLVEESERVVVAGAEIMEVGDPSRLEVVSDLLSADAVKVSPGDTILIEAWGGGTELKGRLRTIEPSGFTKVSALGVEEQRVNVVGDFVTPPARLGDRYRIEVRIVIWQAADVLKLPVSALVRRGSGWAVFAIREGRAHLAPVQVGHRGSSEIELLGGISAGEKVIVHPSDQIAEGVRVGA
jgi:HlyD family secretion protein